MWCFVWASSVANTSFNFAKGWNFRLSCLSSLCQFGGRFRVADNVFGLCVRAGFGAQNCQPALHLNRSTKLQLCTSPRLTQNPCYVPYFYQFLCFIKFNKSRMCCCVCP